jgi:hypothetical protein
LPAERVLRVLVVTTSPYMCLFQLNLIKRIIEQKE